MRITKHEHAALRLETEGETLLIDPGTFTPELDDLENVIAVVLTHEHPDHWTPEHLARIRTAAPGARFYSTAAVAEAVAGASDVSVVTPGDEVTVGAFTLRFFGGDHEVIHSSIPRIRNVGVLVNDLLYYPGDSYAIPQGVEVPVLAAPLGAPWLRIADAIDFVLAVAPDHAFGTHDMTLSAIGRRMHRQRLAWATEQHDGVFHELDPGDAIEVV